MTMSASRASARPPPTAAPLTAAMTGLSQSSSARAQACADCMRARTAGALRPCGSVMARMSPPAQNALPVPVSTMARTAASAISFGTFACIPALTAGESAFIAFGSSRRRTATAPWHSTFTASDMLGSCECGLPSGPPAVGEHDAVVGMLGDLPPRQLLLAEAVGRLERAPEARVLGGQLGVVLDRRLVASLHDGRRERLDDGARGDEALERRRVDGIVPGQHPAVDRVASPRHDRLEGFRQCVPAVEVDDQMHHAAALPPARVVVVLGDTDEPQLLVVVRAQKLGCIDRAVLERGIDVGVPELERVNPEPGQDG